jgi:hypothetical protein
MQAMTVVMVMMHFRLFRLERTSGQWFQPAAFSRPQLVAMLLRMAAQGLMMMRRVFVCER